MHERLITIQGNPININIAVELLHSVSRVDDGPQRATTNL